MSSKTTPVLCVPNEILIHILRFLKKSHDCNSCHQNTLRSLVATCRTFNAVFTPELYRDVVLSATHLVKSSDEEKEFSLLRYQDVSLCSSLTRMERLTRTLKERPALGSHVRRLQFDGHEEGTSDQWHQLVELTPNVQSVQGLQQYFAGDSCDWDEDAEDEDEHNDAVLSVLEKSTLSSMILHNEAIPCSLSELLTKACKSVESLALGEIVPRNDDLTFDDMASAFTDRKNWVEDPSAHHREGKNNFPRLRNVYFYDFDLDPGSLLKQNALLSVFPPLERLGIHDSPKFRLEAVTRFLSQTQAHADTLRHLDIHQQLRVNNPISEIIKILKLARGLKTLSVSLTRNPQDEKEYISGKDRLCSSSLEVLRWVPIYQDVSATTVQQDEMDDVLINSLIDGTMPNLRTLIIEEAPVADGESTSEDAEARRPEQTLESKLVERISATTLSRPSKGDGKQTAKIQLKMEDRSHSSRLRTLGSPSELQRARYIPSDCILPFNPCQVAPCCDESQGTSEAHSETSCSRDDALPDVDAVSGGVEEPEDRESGQEENADSEQMAFPSAWEVFGFEAGAGGMWERGSIKRMWSAVGVDVDA